MVTKARLTDMETDPDYAMRKISALTHAGIKRLCEEETVQLSMFDEKVPIEVTLPDNPDYRYALCLNPVRAEKETSTRRILIENLKAKLNKIAVPKKETDDGTLGIRAGKLLKDCKVGKFFDIKTEGGKLTYTVDENKIAEEELYDGHYVIFTDVKKEDMTIQEVVKSYRSLIQVEQAFRNLKSPTLEIRPVFHRTFDRIRCHVFLCMLAYYIFWNMKQRLQPLFDHDVKGKNRKYTMPYIIETLKGIRKEKISFDNIETEALSEPTEEQQKILDLLCVQLT